VRPVNLIPVEERRGEKAPLRTGPLAYVIVGLLALALAGITSLVLTGNKVADRKTEVASLKSQVAEAKASAARLSAYSDFAAMQEARQQTVTSLASSRFDWERVLRELAILTPSDVWLTDMSAAAAADSTSGSSSSGGTSSALQGVTGPSLDIQGCAEGHEAVAGFLSALRDVDGVTRVGVISSDRASAEGTSGSSSSSSATGGGASCSSFNSISTFDVVVAFDGADPTATAVPAAPATDAPVADQPASDQTAGSDSSSQESGGTASAVVSGAGSTR
jgi:Tfp pilus assembly protein PilN